MIDDWWLMNEDEDDDDDERCRFCPCLQLLRVAFRNSVAKSSQKIQKFQAPPTGWSPRSTLTCWKQTVFFLQGLASQSVSDGLDGLVGQKIAHQTQWNQWNTVEHCGTCIFFCAATFKLFAKSNHEVFFSDLSWRPLGIFGWSIGPAPALPFTRFTRGWCLHQKPVIWCTVFCCSSKSLYFSFVSKIGYHDDDDLVSMEIWNLWK